MATVNLGLIKFRWQGAYAGGTAYVKDDVVSYNGSSYVCILASTGNLPTNTTYWNVMAQGGTDITSLAGLAQGDILYYNGTDWVRLGAGTNGQVLQTGGAGANPSWGTLSSKVVNVVYATNATQYTATQSYVTATNHTVSITPQSASNIIYIQWSPNVRQTSGSSDNGFQYNFFRTVGATTTTIESVNSVDSYWYDTSGGNRLQFPRYILIRDNTHNTTSQITYSFEFRNPHSSLTTYISSDSTNSDFLVWEVQP